MTEQDTTWDALPPEQEQAFQQLEQMLAARAEARAASGSVLMPGIRCASCRWWHRDEADGHQPRWGICHRLGGSPPAPMMAVTEDGSAALLLTAPSYACRAWED